METSNKRRRDLMLFFILVGAAALGNGLSDSVYSNYFKEVYQVTATQRAFIEFPRELPGVLCSVVIALLSVIGDIRLCLLAQVLACTGLTALGIFTPSFGVMLIFLFINSLGMHLFMPLSDSVAMSLAEPGKVGTRIGQSGRVKTAMGFIAGIVVFVGFRTGFFSFQTQMKTVFLLGSCAFLLAIAIGVLLVKAIGGTPKTKRRFNFVFRREYKLYYLLTVLNGVQKQIAYVFGSWVIIDLLAKRADTMSLLILTASFIGIFFMGLLGGWIDKYGVKKMMYLDALTFIIIYTIYGMVVWGITSKVLPSAGFSVVFIYVLFVSDRLSMQIGVVKAVYLRSIAVNAEEITATLSTGTSLDHIVAIMAAQLSGLIWTYCGPQWVFFMAAAFSLGNLYVARTIKE